MAALIEGMDAANAAVQGELVGTLVPAILVTLQCWVVAFLATTPLRRSKVGER